MSGKEIVVNAYLIAAKANAWEVDQQVGRAIEADQPERVTEALGCGAGSAAEGKGSRRARLFRFLRAA